jgi:hypothetical protein
MFYRIYFGKAHDEASDENATDGEKGCYGWMMITSIMVRIGSCFC